MRIGERERGLGGEACFDFHGLRVMPLRRLSVRPAQPNSGNVVLPRMTQPASRSRATTGESASAGVSGVVSEPWRVGKPLTSTLSLMVTGAPSSGPSDLAVRKRSDACGRKRAVAIDDLERVETRLQHGDARQMPLGDLERRQRSVAKPCAERCERQETILVYRHEMERSAGAGGKRAASCGTGPSFGARAFSATKAASVISSVLATSPSVSAAHINMLWNGCG